eukprot:gene30222-35210_t
MYMWLLLLLLTSLCILVAGEATADKNALLAFASAAAHPGLSSWITGNDMCTEYASVICLNGRVSSLYLQLPPAGGVFAIPAEFSNLDALTSLKMMESNLGGGIPDLSPLSALVMLDLRGNSLTQSLPAYFSLMTGLQLLDMSGNDLTGTLPGAWSSLSNLERLFLEKNGLTGTLPAAYSALTALRTTFVGGNALTGTLPGSWDVLTKLQVLQLPNNQFTGTLPTEYWMLWPNLIVMDASNNLFTGLLLATSFLSSESLGPNLDPLAFVRAFVPKIHSCGRALIERSPFSRQSVLCSSAQPVAFSARSTPPGSSPHHRGIPSSHPVVGLGYRP